MTTGDGAELGADARGDQQDRAGRGDRIGVGASDESVARIQLAARWAEAYGVEADSLGAILKRFRAAYEYLDAVTHGVEPPDTERDSRDAQGSPPTTEPAAPRPTATAVPSPLAPPAAAPPEPRPWG